MNSAVVVLASILLVGCREGIGDEEARPWALPKFMMIDAGKDATFVHIDGTLLGPDVGYKVNTMALDCYRDEKVCRVADVQELGRDQLGRISVVDWPVVLWSDTTIVAQDETIDTGSCAQNTITINRVAKTVAYDSKAQHQDRPYCNHFGKPRDEHWTIGDPKQPWDK